MSSEMKNPLLQVEDLSISLLANKQKVFAVSSLSFSIYPEETLALVGESGCGKSLTAHALIGIPTSESVHTESGKIIFQNQNLLEKGSRAHANLRGKDIAFISQNPLSALNPTLTVGFQLIESIHPTFGYTGKQKKAKAIEMLELVGFSDAKTQLLAYPHELSGGMRQRVLIAIALINHPKLVIADEPTTALDVTIQAQILELLEDLKKKLGMSLLFITHDLGIVARIADRVAVMYAGQIVEIGTTDEIYYSPKHPYTQGLLSCVPNLETSISHELMSIPGSPPEAGIQALCPFLPRCPKPMRLCVQQAPQLVTFGKERQVRCWYGAKERAAL